MKNHGLLATAIVAVSLASTTARSDETVRHLTYGGEATTTTLKFDDQSEAATVPVFHGRIAACLFGCRRPVYYAPVPVYYGCVGGFGGVYSPTPVPMMGIAARPAPAYPSAPSYAYRGPTPTFRLPPSQAIVSLPRLGLSIQISDDNGLTVGRSSIGNSLTERLRPQSEVPALPPVAPRPDQFQYDGGPSNPIPLPRSARPMPEVDPRTAPLIDNRAKLKSTGGAWTAYGEKPKRVSNPHTLLVQQRIR
jgi:hypothetical protein